jgi:peroxiredoxin
LTELGVRVYALSVDSRKDAAKTVKRHDLSFPVGYGLDLDEVVRKIGAYADREKGHLQATSFILRDGAVVHATYSSGPLGRLQAEHVAGFVEYVSKGS